MWIKSIVLLCCIGSACLASTDESRPSSSSSSTKKKDEVRGKRNLQYSISHYGGGPIPAQSYKLERRISTGSQIPSLYHSPFFPGPIRSYSPYHNKGRPYSLPAPPYAVQMEPLVQYSQRDPLYDTNFLSLHTDGQNEDLLTDNNHLNENVYGPPVGHQTIHKQIVERPVYIKEPEPIIEIIIKESNVTLPPLPTAAPPPPKKKEQVQVFYVKYKKNPNGSGKDSVIYEKPVPAISPPIQDEHEEPSQEEHHHHQEYVTLPPPPSTTLRTVIRPESETYHSPSGVKVTFGKEGFDYEKRSNKPEDLKPAQPSEHHRSIQFPQPRQLSSSFPPSFPRSRPSNFNNFPPNNFRSEPQRQPQPYRPFSQSSPPQYRPAPPVSFPRPNPNPAPQQYSTLPKYLTESKPNNQQFTPTRPAPPQFHQQQIPSSPARQPVAYQPFDSLRPQHQPPQSHPQIQFRPQTHFPVNQQLPLGEKPNNFNQFNNQNHQHFQQQQHPDVLRQQPFKQEQPRHQQQLPKQNSHSPSFSQPIPQHFNQQPPQQHSQPQFNPQPQFNHHQSQFNQQQNHQQQQQQQFNQQENPLQHTQNVIPPGGELIHSLPKFEQHISILEPNRNQPPQALPLQQSTPLNQPHSQFTQQTQIQPQIHSHGEPQPSQQRPIQIQSQQQQQPQHQLQEQSQNHLSQSDLNEKIQQQLREANALQESIRNTHTHQQFFNYNSQTQDQQPRFLPTTTYYQSTTSRSYSSTTQRPTTTTTTQAPSTTTEEPEKPSTTTKDPKILNLQLPDEVPDDLREQLLSSGILNNADISVLDYDKVGDIPLSALPPDQLANFYNAGGAQQISSSGSAPIPSVVRPDGSAIDRIEENRDEEEAEASEIREVRTKPEVQMKVVHYDPQTERGQQVQDAYVKDDATQVDPVVLNDAKYNRYLPLKVSGTQFPIPDVPELKGKKISSVVVLAPVTYDFSSERKTREAKKESADDIDLIEGDALKELLKSPSKENFRKFLDSENKTRSDKQAVILLVTAGTNGDKKEKEIFMYDVATQTVSKLDGELSSAFVEAAEANANDDEGDVKPSASNIIETRVPFTNSNHRNFLPSDSDLEDSASDLVASKIPIIDARDLDADGSEHLESFVDISGVPIEHDLTMAASEYYPINSKILGSSKTGQRKLLPLP